MDDRAGQEGLRLADSHLNLNFIDEGGAETQYEVHLHIIEWVSLWSGTGRLVQRHWDGRYHGHRGETS